MTIYINFTLPKRRIFTLVFKNPFMYSTWFVFCIPFQSFASFILELHWTDFQVLYLIRKRSGLECYRVLFLKGREGWGKWIGWEFFRNLGPQVWNISIFATIAGVVIVITIIWHCPNSKILSRKVSLGSVAYFRTWSLNDERKTSMALPGIRTQTLSLSSQTC